MHRQSNLPYSFGLRENVGASFTVMVVAFLSAFAFMGFCTLYLRHCAHLYVATGNPISAAAELCRRGCNQQVIDNCPIVKYSTVKEIKMGKEALECAVCLAEFQDYDRLRLLPKCNHVFHTDCIDAWLSSHATCPLCRAKLTSDCGQNLTQLLPRNMNEPQYPQNYSNRTPESSSAGEMERNQVAVEVLPGSELQLPATSIAINTVENVTQVFALNQIQTPRPSPPLGLGLLLEALPRSHSTGHSLLEVEPEQGNYRDRCTLRLPEHVKKQILANHNRIRRLPTSDIGLPKLWSPRREWNGSELAEAASSRQV
ncbi:hypothetical protein L6164_025187 [Bauhinia variegata]|uniref:Uncharacterized protein n=1 Tax=Bauhinia variegata TaxID=167791 RepID=A0ACB9LZT7_BAUVA|nr:hypothetical protein L6164_025187 [Bauhinia variegata]